MKPILVTDTVPARSLSDRRSKWSATDKDFDAVGWRMRNDDDPDPTREQMDAISKIEIERFAKVMKGLLVVVERFDVGYEWWIPAELAAACLSGDDEFEPGIHDYKVYAPAQLIRMLQSEVDDMQGQIATLRRMMRLRS